MTRVIKSLQYDIQRWQDFAADDGAEVMRVVDRFSAGSRAYAYRQCALRQRMLEHAQHIFSQAPGDEKVVVGVLPSDIVDVTVDLDTI